jgi:hypothetical protein
MISHCQASPAHALAYFYFDFNDIQKQNHGNLVRSLISQLCVQSAIITDSLDALYSQHKDGQQQPSIDDLTTTLRDMLRVSEKTFIIVDALDECTNRSELLEIIDTMVAWKIERLHILTTSRREMDIEETLVPIVTDQVCLQSAKVNADIKLHISERLQNDPKLKKWPSKVQMEIEETLMAGANGM